MYYNSHYTVHNHVQIVAIRTEHKTGIRAKHELAIKNHGEMTKLHQNFRIRNQLYSVEEKLSKRTFPFTYCTLLFVFSIKLKSV